MRLDFSKKGFVPTDLDGDCLGYVLCRDCHSHQKDDPCRCTSPKTAGMGDSFLYCDDCQDPIRNDGWDQ